MPFDNDFAPHSIRSDMTPIVEPCEHTFATIIGHTSAKQYLEHAVADHILPHALLITGPKGIGRTSLAYALTKRINCSFGAAPDCTCHICRKIRLGRAPDVLFIEPRSASGQLTLAGWKPGKDDPDDLQYYRFVETPPLEFSQKVLVLRKAERMNLALSNYLLKLIEEPPSYLTILLLASRPTDVLPTIRSRCAPLSLYPLSMTEMETFARGISSNLTPEALRLLLVISGGRPGRFLDLIKHDAHADHAALASEMNHFRQHGFLALFGTARRLAQRCQEGDAAEKLTQTLDALLMWLRDAMLHRTLSSNNAMQLAFFRDVEEQVRQFAETSELEALVSASRAVVDAYEYVPRQTDRTYVLELLLTRIGRALRSR